MPAPDLHPVILCGGAGARLWPRSSARVPKPFLELVGDQSLLQATALRMAAVPGARKPILVLAAGHEARARAQLAAVGLEAFIIAEPVGRGSAAAIVAAALEIAQGSAGAVMLVAASDHFVPDLKAYGAGVIEALAAADQGYLVTFGVAPSGPSTAFGYLRPGRELAGAVRALDGFVEKPDLARANALVATDWLWNSGDFVFRADALLAEAGKLVPALVAAVEAARGGGRRGPDSVSLGEAFDGAPDGSIDVAIMERTDRAAVLPVAYGWSDIGAWDAVAAARPRDGAGNALEGKVVAQDCEDCLIMADGETRIVALGLKRIAVVVEKGRVLVCDLDRAQAVREAGEAADGL